MNERLVKFSKIFVGVVLATGLLRACLLTNVPPGAMGVRYNNATGLNEEDFAPGWHWEIPGLQRIALLPSRYLFLNYTETEGDALSIRTKDNNTVTVDVSVPYRIIPGSAWKVMDAGNHQQGSDGSYRFERFANETAISVLREQLARLQSQDFYNTDRRLQVADETLQLLNEQLAPLHLEASAILIRAAYFRTEYEQQLAQIQLNEQSKLLDNAKKLVADERQKLDNYVQQTNALAAAKEQDWNRKIAELDRAYQVGSVDIGDDRSPGAARRKLASLPEGERQALREKAAGVFEIDLTSITDAHLLGIKNVQAETTEYERRVRAEADGVAARLSAEGQARVARVKGAFESKLNTLLGSPGGRAYVAYQAADNVKFESGLTFQSAEGIPSVLRLRDFAIQFMGR